MLLEKIFDTVAQYFGHINFRLDKPNYDFELGFCTISIDPVNQLVVFDYKAGGKQTFGFNEPKNIAKVARYVAYRYHTGEYPIYRGRETPEFKKWVMV